MAYLLGWKDILRPIRDGYRHLFPAPDTGPTPEERRKQRDLDRLKGFAYFDTFDQLEAWTEDNCDSFQRANTPRIRTEDRSTNKGLGKADVLLIHDYSGNYHDYESVQATGVDAELYSCEYLQFVDVFIYFSHKLVCVPPPTWTNTLHRNGVEVLGTLLVEPQTEGSERLLQHTRDGQNMDFPLAKTLARIASYYGFDGWLVNIEKRFPNNVWDPEILEAFLCQLRAEMGGTMRLIWYDALTISNKISYQNALNTSNIKFASACGSILTNYCWKDTEAENSLQLALSSKISPRNIFFGIDVWAQNKSSFTHPRVTYPEYGGGGTNTGVAVAKLADLGLSAGIFAPAWSFEHFPGKGRDAERTVWQGIPLPRDMDCSCGDCLSRHQPNEALAVLKYAKERVSGSENFFYTDFTRAFATHDDASNDLFDGCSIHAQLGSQSILPRPAIFGDRHQAVGLWHRLDNSSRTSRLVIEAMQYQSNSDATTEVCLPLFKLDMPADGYLQAEIYSNNVSLPADQSIVTLYIRTTDSVQLFTITLEKGIQRTVCPLKSLVPGARIQELGIHLKGSIDTALGKTLHLMNITSVRIMPISTFQMSSLFSIDQIQLEKRGEGDCARVQLVWNFRDHGRTNYKDNGIPCSNITGPFSYFVIYMDGRMIGKAYALEHILKKRFVEKNAGSTVELELVGCILARLPHTLPRVYYQLHPSALVFTAPQARQLHASAFTMSPLKRKHEKETSPPKSKKPKVEIPAYHLAQSRQDGSCEIVWPARREQIERARTIIKECAIAQKSTVIMPDKDADGLSSGAILYHTLTTLGLSSDHISVYFPPKGSNVHDESTREALAALSPVYIFVLDQGSRKSPPLVDFPHTCLIIDHHFADEGGFPEGAEYVTAHDCPPVATSALLTYNICLPLHADSNNKVSWLAALGTHGDLGGTIKWEPPFPDMKATFKQHTKKAINDAVALVNAPRRSAAYNVEDAWAAVLSAESPGAIVKDEKLRNASLEVRRETERCTHTPPTFSADATIALLSISSAAQIHPVIATRWSGTLKSNKLEIVMCANEGYLPDRVNFSCRVAKCARAREGEEKIDIIKKLEGIVAGDKDLRARLGESFARGHKEASGGIVGKQEWEDFKKLMGVGERTKTEPATRKEKPTQKNTLANYFGKSAKA
ncbi:glycoside hydrolase family 85 protein [Bipolaris zeicola 26-R-13]|uniref:Glycoside hydrolase family 85 protein n=1 Tax=Cochliobolus carbonum (strain 26-R-13) TaxID=930089 RepID=W6YLQ6_COCC2|nr:glycoside hydrolase family 85 protein [Bipolaris zeicola 26-R-13]EUC38448.1 glycoside hydrolase family 85 protein [Bipolaris zeicola 26-R-13]